MLRLIMASLLPDSDLFLCSTLTMAHCIFNKPSKVVNELDSHWSSCIKEKSTLEMWTYFVFYGEEKKFEDGEMIMIFHTNFYIFIYI